MWLRLLIRGLMVCCLLRGLDELANGFIDHNGAFLTNGNLAVEGDLRPTVTKATPEDWEKLWKLSEKLVGQEFTY